MHSTQSFADPFAPGARPATTKICLPRSISECNNQLVLWCLAHYGLASCVKSFLFVHVHLPSEQFLAAKVEEINQFWEQGCVVRFAVVLGIFDCGSFGI